MAATNRVTHRIATIGRSASAAPARRRLGLAWLLAVAPATGFACACGCGVFDVGTASMFPQHSGFTAFLEFDAMDQNRNWSGTSSAPAADNPDKEIRTFSTTAGLHYQFDRAWGLAVAVPYLDRLLRTEEGNANTPVEVRHAALGDVRITGLYTGFEGDMSSGVTFGLKLATGDTSYRNFDADTQIGTGSTDALLGGYHLGSLTDDNRWRYFVQAQWDQPLSYKAQYRPGAEVDASLGAYYEGWALGPSAKLAPVLEFNATWRASDGGSEGDPANTGYTRFLVTPGLELDVAELAIYLDVGLPVYMNAHGNQLVSPRFWRLNVSHRF